MSSVCEQLDDYLDGELTSEEASRFRDHVEYCSACRVNLEAMAEFDELVAEAKSSFDEWYVSHATQDRPALVDGIQVVATQRSLAGRVLASVAVVAATIALVVVARDIAMRMPGNPPHREIGRSSGSSGRSGVEVLSDSTEIAQLTKARVNMTEDSRYLAQPIESSNPNITIYWLHPTVDAVSDSEDVDSSLVPEEKTNLLARKAL